MHTCTAARRVGCQAAPHFLFALVSLLCGGVMLQGYNKRATIYYLMGRYEESIEDCKTVLQLQVMVAVCR